MIIEIGMKKKFQKLIKFDIQSCFDSIYTHSIAWALNGGKDTYKENFTSNEKTMGYLWDKVMQRMNYNETNGIVIGPEFSRIFAEVILQQIDNNVLSKLASKKYYNNVDYQCFRYVDDYFFFYNAEDIKDEALTLFTNELKTYKLTISNEKTLFFERPFKFKDFFCTGCKICLLKQNLFCCIFHSVRQIIPDSVETNISGSFQFQDIIMPEC